MKSHAAIAAVAFAAVAAAQSADDDVVAAPRKQFVPTTVKAPFIEQFTDDWTERWTPSAATKKQAGGEAFSYSGKWSVEEPYVFPGLEGDKGLVAKSKAAQHAISAPFPEIIYPDGKQLVIQYETKFQTGLQCGGAYLKLLTESPEGIQAQEFSDKTPYTIMFGPDRCGKTNKVHLIFRHKSPITGEIEEKHLTDTAYPKLPKTTTLYTLVVNPDNTFEVLINNEMRKRGTLLEEFEPPVNPEVQIDDPEDFKPADWVEDAKIPDPASKKPDDWDESAPLEIPDTDASKPEGWLEDEPLQIPDPDAVKPEEWDDDEDGEWSPPVVLNPKCVEAPGCGPWTPPTKRNPNYKGKWVAPMIENPAYKGEWSPRKISNPAYFKDEYPAKFTPMAGIGFEIWTMDEDILFDNIYVGYSREEAKKLSEETFELKLPIEQGLEKKVEEAEKKKKEEEDAKTAAAAPAGDSLIAKIRSQVDVFLAAARKDPKAAVKEYPQVAAGLVGITTIFFGLLGLIGGVLGSAAPSAQAVADKAKAAADKTAKGTKKVDEPAASKAKTTAVKDRANGSSKRTIVTAGDEDDE